MFSQIGGEYMNIPIGQMGGETLSITDTAMAFLNKVASVAILVSLALPMAVSTASAQSGGHSCVANNGGNSCSANDVRITSFTVADNTQSCVIGEEYTVTLIAEIESKPQRYNIGFWFTEDGTSAFDGDMCYRDYLPPPLESDLAQCNTMGGPYFDGDGNSCGDVPASNAACAASTTRPCSQGGGTCLVTQREITITTICADADGDNIADISSCTSWSENNNAACSGVADTNPSGGPKCHCSTVSTSTIFTGCLSDAECDDGAFCNGAESCSQVTGECEAGTPPLLDDGVACTDDSCDEANDVVLHSPNNGICDNNAWCDGSETCNAILGCQAGSPPNIDDGVACTDDSCDEVNDVVVNTVNDGNCDDGLWCNGAETCDAVLDCQAGTAPDIDDGVACTDDSCDETNDVVVNTVNDGNCDNGQFCDGAETCDAVLDCQAGIPEPIDTPCGDQSDTLCTAPDSCDGAGQCVANNEECGAVTSSALCEFDIEEDKGSCDGGLYDGSACSMAGGDDCAAGGGVCRQTKQFRLGFGPDAQNWVAYKAGATNPGQFYYNAFYDATSATDDLVIHMEIPYPFITQGATPMHVYDGELVGMTSEGCYDPVEELMNHKYEITENDWLQPDGYTLPPYLSCEKITGAGDSGLCLVSVVVPQQVIDATVSNFLYVNLHLDYGFKGNFTDLNPNDGAPDRYDRGGYVSPWNSSDALVNTSDNTGEIAIADCSVYNFAHYIEDDPTPVHEDAVENLNEFKRFTGVFGRVSCDDGLAIGGFLDLVDSDGMLAKSTEIDAEGYYGLSYKHKGRSEAYHLVWCADAGCSSMHATDSFMLQSNGEVEVNLEATDLCDDLDGNVDGSDWQAILPVYTKGKYANK
jgi:hypothetical protein